MPEKRGVRRPPRVEEAHEDDRGAERRGPADRAPLPPDEEIGDEQARIELAPDRERESEASQAHRSFSKRSMASTESATIIIWTFSFWNAFTSGSDAQTREERRSARVPTSGPKRRATASRTARTTAEIEGEPDHAEAQEVRRDEEERARKEEERRRILVDVHPEAVEDSGLARSGRGARQRVERVVVDVRDVGHGLSGDVVRGHAGVAGPPSGSTARSTPPCATGRR